MTNTEICNEKNEFISRLQRIDSLKQRLQEEISNLSSDLMKKRADIQSLYMIPHNPAYGLDMMYQHLTDANKATIDLSKIIMFDTRESRFKIQDNLDFAFYVFSMWNELQERRKGL